MSWKVGDYPRFPPGYGYRAFADLKTTGRRSLFDQVVTFVLGAIVYGCAVYAAGVVTVVVAVVISTMRPAHGRDLGQWETSNPEVREWYRGLMQPDAPNTSCCGEADAYFADEVHVRNGKTFATVTDDRDDAPLGRPHVDVGTVIEIPPHKLKWDRANPTGHGVVFLSRQGFVFCFVQGTGI